MMVFLAKLIAELLKMFIPALIESSKDTYIEADSQKDVKKSFVNSVKGTWGVALICLVLLAGCFQRTIYVPDGTPVKLRETIKNAKVWVMVNGKPEPKVMDLPEGWFAASVDLNK